jgi:hypothetical protein
MTRSLTTAPLLTASLALLAPASALAQQPQVTYSSTVWEGWSVGAAIGRAGNEDDHHVSDDRGVDLRANLEIPLAPRITVRAEAGRVTWRFDRFDPLDPQRADDVTVRRITVGLLGVTDPAVPLRGHFGAGLGLYHWKAKAGPIEKSFTRGAWFTAGLTFPVKERKWAITGEIQIQVIHAPNENPPASARRLVGGSAVMSLTPSIGLRLFL